MVLRAGLWHRLATDFDGRAVVGMVNVNEQGALTRAFAVRPSGSARRTAVTDVRSRWRIW